MNKSSTSDERGVGADSDNSPQNAHAVPGISTLRIESNDNESKGHPEQQSQQFLLQEKHSADEPLAAILVDQNAPSSAAGGAISSQNTAKESTFIKNKDMLALRSYIMSQDETQYENVHQSTVILDLTHSNLVQRHIEIRFDLHDTLETLRRRIHQKTGTSPTFQHLQVMSGGHILMEIPPTQPDSYKLGYFGLHHGMQIHCVDINPSSGSKGGQYEDVSLVKKYTMTDEEYNSRTGTLRDWQRQQKAKDSSFTLAKHAREHRELIEAQRQHKLRLALPKNFHVDATGKVVRCDDDEHVVRKANAVTNASASNNNNNNMVEHGPESVTGMEVGQRCEVQPGSRRGQVAFVGEIPELGGFWVGVLFDEPVGKTDGTVPIGSGRGAMETKRYFDAPSKQGGFIRGKNIQVGDFPERDLFEDSDEEDEL